MGKGSRSALLWVALISAEPETSLRCLSRVLGLFLQTQLLDAQHPFFLIN